MQGPGICCALPLSHLIKYIAPAGKGYDTNDSLPVLNSSFQIDLHQGD